MSYASTALTKKTTILTLQKMKSDKQKFVTVALYDAPMAAMAERSGVEVILVGDSLGMTVLGFDSTIPVTMENMIYHIAAVSRGSKNCLIMGDMPFMSYATTEDALHNAARLMQAGAHMVKLEGGDWLSDTVSKLSDRGIPVCAHIGLTPQSVNKFGGFRVQGRSEHDARKLKHDAKALERAGADILLLECVPAELTAEISAQIAIPTIGIGAGNGTFNWGDGTIKSYQVNVDSTITYNGNLTTGYAANPNASSTLNLGELAFSGGVIWDDMTVNGNLNLASSNDVLDFWNTVSKLRPNGDGEVTGAIELINVTGTLSGQFDTVLGPQADSRFFQFYDTGPTAIPNGTAADALRRNTGYLDYRAGDGIYFVYKISGAVPEPGTAGLLLLGALMIKGVRAYRMGARKFENS